MSYDTKIIAKPAAGHGGVAIENHINLETGVVQHRLSLPGLKNPFASKKARWADLALYISDLDTAIESVDQLSKLLAALKANDGVVDIGGETLDIRYQKTEKAPSGAIGQQQLDELFGSL